MPRTDHERRKARRARAFGAKADYIRQLPCCACGAQAPSDPHHHPTRGAGGTSKDLVPLCRSCHNDFHAQGADTFEARWSVDLKAKAQQYEEWFTNDPQDLGF